MLSLYIPKLKNYWYEEKFNERKITGLLYM